jgi:hypothetical protein
MKLVKVIFKWIWILPVIYLLQYGLYYTVLSPVRPVISGPGAWFVSKFRGTEVKPQPLQPVSVPQNPFMAATVSNNMHNDSYLSDVYNTPGPVGKNTTIHSSAKGLVGGMCPSPNFDSRGFIQTVCVDFSRQDLYLLDAVTLETLASYKLPLRPSIREGLQVSAYDTSGGAYFYIDQLDRAVIAAADWTIKVIAYHGDSGKYAFEMVREYDLASFVKLSNGDLDTVTTVMPDWDGNYWWVTRHGIVGVTHPDMGATQIMRIPGEEFQNSFAVGEDGVYMVSDYALYRFVAVDGMPTVIWREEYDHGTRLKPGQINQGSGTSPTLLANNLVVITDNAEPQIHVIFYHRENDNELLRVGQSRKVCEVPVFEPGFSATENSLIGYDHSIIIVNNFGPLTPIEQYLGKNAVGGMARVDLSDDLSDCKVVWENSVDSLRPVPKLSTVTGLIYTHTKMRDAPLWTDAYYLTAVDFRTGKVAFEVLTGTGLLYYNMGGPFTIGDDGRSYQTILNGLAVIEDQPERVREIHPELVFWLISAGITFGIIYTANRKFKRQVTTG